jgi:hypothetical protein
MGYASGSQSRALSDADVFLLRDRMIDLSGRLTDGQILLLTESLQKVLRMRRGDFAYRHVDMRL